MTSEAPPPVRRTGRQTHHQPATPVHPLEEVAADERPRSHGRTHPPRRGVPELDHRHRQPARTHRPGTGVLPGVHQRPPRRRMDATTAGPEMIDYRILVTGSRECSFDDILKIETIINDVIIELRGTAPEPVGDITVVDGECETGVDRAVKLHCARQHLTHEPHPADWHTHHSAAGPIRNQEMVDLGADLCLAFPRRTSRGTWDCIRKAADAGIPVRIYPLSEPEDRQQRLWDTEETP